MVESKPLRPRWAIVAALIAVVFGIVTIFVGGKTLFGGTEERAAAGGIVPFVLWFNLSPALHTLLRVSGCSCGSVGRLNCQWLSPPRQWQCSSRLEFTFFLVARSRGEPSARWLFAASYGS